MKSETKEFLEQSVLCAALVGIIFHLNSKLSPQPEQTPDYTHPKTEIVERADSVMTDTLKKVPTIWAATQNQKKR